MKKGVYKLIISIIITISVIVVSIPLWNLMKNDKIGIFSVDYSKLPVTIDIGKFPSLIVIDDEKALSQIVPTSILIKNRNGFETNNNLYFLYDKNSTIDYKYLRVSIDDQIFNLESLPNEENGNDIYFKLIDLKMNSYEEKKLNVRIWITPSVEGLDSRASLTTNFIIK